MKKKECHTGFRNGKLFCANCGGEKSLVFPSPVESMTKTMKDFDKLHSKCKPTWTQPVVDPNLSVPEKMKFWLNHGEQGMSSKAMFSKFSGHRFDEHYQNHPCDPDDFSRCYKLIQTIPEWKPYLSKLSDISPQWEKVVNNWDKLSSFYEEMMFSKEANGMYEFMEELGL